MPVRMTPSRVDSIYTRQRNPGWDSGYQPSILSTRQEGATSSYVGTVSIERFGRKIHLQSTPECMALVLALHNPALCGIQEQRMLSPLPHPHPLANFPGAIAGGLRPLQGTIATAVSMNMLQKLRMVKSKSGYSVPYPMTGDLLLAFKTGNSTVYCVNWNIKADETGFHHSPGSKRKPDLSTLGTDGFRHQIEERYYADAGIPTVHLAVSMLDANLMKTLYFLAQSENHCWPVSTEIRLDMEEQFQNCILQYTPVNTLHAVFQKKYGLHPCEINMCFFEAVWHRRIEVDLYKPPNVDKPLRLPRTDPLIVYKHLFEGNMP